MICISGVGEFFESSLQRSVVNKQRNTEKLYSSQVVRCELESCRHGSYQDDIGVCLLTSGPNIQPPGTRYERPINSLKGM